MENVRKNRNIKLVTTERRTNYLVPYPIFYNTKFFTKSLLAIEMKKKNKNTCVFRIFNTRIK